MHDDGYTTPEGHWLARPLLLPDVRDFSDLAQWSYAHGATVLDALRAAQRQQFATVQL